MNSSSEEINSKQYGIKKELGAVNVLITSTLDSGKLVFLTNSVDMHASSYSEEYLRDKHVYLFDTLKEGGKTVQLLYDNP